MSEEILNIVLLLAAAQGIFLSILIFHRHGRLFANRFLGLLMLFYSIILLDLFLWEIGYYFKHPYYKILAAGLSFLIGPLHYFYARYLINPAQKVKKILWLHLLPCIIYYTYFSSDLFKSSESLIAYYQSMEITGIPTRYLVFNWVVSLQGLTYTVAIISILRKYAQRIKNVFSTIEKIRLDWLRNITYMAFVIICLFFVETVLFTAGINLSNYFSFSSFLIVIYVYALGYLGLFNSEIFTNPAIAESIKTLPQLAYSDIKEGQQESKKYKKSGLSQEKAKQYIEVLLNFMKKEKPFIDPNLTLTQLSNTISISPHNLSEVLNTQLNQNFFDFINQYRIEEVKRELANPGKQHLKILAIAYDAGFNSKTSFNTIFKKHTNITPSDYRKQVSPHAPA